jgi:hypothetical protein
MRGRIVRARKRAEAEARAKVRALRTPAQQAAVLAERGHGHCAESRKLRGLA